MFKRKQAKIFGATHAVASVEEALPLLNDLTWGRLADKVLITVAVASGALIAPARTYSLDQVNEGYDAMLRAENVRGVIMY